MSPENQPNLNRFARFKEKAKERFHDLQLALRPKHIHHTPLHVSISQDNLTGAHSHVPDLTLKKENDNRVGIAAVGLAGILLAGGLGYELGRRHHEDEVERNLVEIYPNHPLNPLIINIFLPEKNSLPTASPTIEATPTLTPEPTQSPTPEPTPTPTKSPTPTPTEAPTLTPLPTPEPTPLPTIEAPQPIIGEAYRQYVLDGWYLVDGDVFVQGSQSSEFVPTYDDIESTAQETIAGPGTIVSGFYGFTAYPLGETLNLSDDTTAEFVSFNINKKFDETVTGPNGQYQFEVIYLDQLEPNGTIYNVETFYR